MGLAILRKGSSQPVGMKDFVITIFMYYIRKLVYLWPRIAKLHREQSLTSKRLIKYREIYIPLTWEIEAFQWV